MLSAQDGSPANKYDFIVWPWARCVFHSSMNGTNEKGLYTYAFAKVSKTGPK